MELDIDLDIVRAAKDHGMYVTTFWRLVIAPALNAIPFDAYGKEKSIVSQFKRRAFLEIAGIIPTEVEKRWFTELLENPRWRGFTSSTYLRSMGVGRIYAARRMLTYLERHMRAHPNEPKFNLLLAAIVPILPPADVDYLIKTGEYPLTLGPFARTPALYGRIEKLAGMKKEQAKKESLHGARYDEPQTKYLARVEERRAARVDEHVRWLNTNEPDLKAFARYLRDTLPANCSRKMPNPVGVMQYVNQRLRSRIPAATYNTLHQQADVFARTLRPAHRVRLDSLK